MNDERVDATEMPRPLWRALNTRADYPNLVLAECGLRAKRVTSRKGRQFFAHYPSVHCRVEHKSESEQHMVMKQSLKDRINATAGWSAEVEVSHPERSWTADVMATHSSGKRLAFEVQLSQQTEEEYIRRSQRYIDDGIGPVWVVPASLEHVTVRLPIIVTGFGKTSPLPETPADLMNWLEYQPMAGAVGRIGVMVDTILGPSFRWPHGTPRHQLEERERRVREEAERAAAAQKEAARLAEEKRLRDGEAARFDAERVARFVGSAAAPGRLNVAPVLAGTTIWASEVRCLNAGHPMLIWRLTEPGRTDGNDRDWMPRSENFDNVRSRVDSWLEAARTGLAKAGVQRLEGVEHRRGYSCPECKEVVRGRWVTAIPPARWSVIAEARRSREVLYCGPAAPPPGSAPVVRTAAPEPSLGVQPVRPPAVIQEDDPEFFRPPALGVLDVGGAGCEGDRGTAGGQGREGGAASCDSGKPPVRRQRDRLPVEVQ